MPQPALSREIDVNAATGIPQLAFHPDGGGAVVSDAAGAYSWWNFSASSNRNIAPPNDEGVIPVGLAFSADGRRFASAGSDRRVRIFDVNRRRALRSILHPVDVTGIVLSKDGKMLIVADKSRTVRVYDTDSTRELANYVGHGADVSSMAFSADEKRITTSSLDGEVRIWDAEFEPAVHVFQLPRPLIGLNTIRSSIIARVAFSPDGNNLAATTRDGVYFYDLKMQKVQEGNLAHEGLYDFAFGANGALAATTGSDGKVRIWNVRDRKEIRVLDQKRKDGNLAVAFSPDGKLVATGGDDRTSTVWDMQSGTPIAVLASNFGHTGTSTTVAFSPDGAWLATSSKDTTAKIWDARTGKHLRTLIDHDDAVTGLVWGLDGKLATMSDDEKVKIWDSVSGKVLRTIGGARSPSSSVSFSPDGSRLAISGIFDSTRIIDTASGKELRSFPAGLQAVFGMRGDRIAVAPVTGESVRVYAFSSAETLVKIAAERVSRNLTFDECQSYRLLHTASCMPQALMAQGNERAKALDVNGAIAAFKRALKSDRNLGINPEIEARRLAAERLVLQARTNAKIGDYEKALGLVKTARGVNNSLEPRIESGIQAMAFESLSTTALQQVRHGSSQEGLATWKRAVTLAAPGTNMGEPLNNLCWWGTLHGEPAMFSDICEKAVAEDPSSYNFVDSRALNRALTGYLSGAIADFEKATATPSLGMEFVRVRRQWLEELKRGNNPFTATELARLRRN